MPGKCPICGEPTAQNFRPFCSARCAEIDLGRWLKGSYAIAAVEEDDVDEAAMSGDETPEREPPG